MKRWVLVVLLLACFFIIADASSAESTKPVFVRGGKILFSEAFSTTPMSEIPPGPILFSGNCEVVLIGSENWLKAFPNTSMRVNLQSGITDLTLEYIFRSRNYHRGLKIELEGVKYKGQIDLGMLDGALHYQGTGQGKALPSGTVKHTAYRENDTNRLALVIKDQKAMIFLNNSLIMDVPDFVPVFPENINMHLNTHEKAELYVKDFLVATAIPDQR